MQTKITLKGTLVMIDYCSESLMLESEDSFLDNYYQTAGFLDWEDGGLFVNDDDENDLMKQKGKYVKTKEHFHELFKEDGEHPLPVILHTRHYRFVEADYIIEHEDEFDIKKVQLVKSDYEIECFPYLIIADYILYDGKKVDVEGDLYDLCPEEKMYNTIEVDSFY